MKSKPPTVDRFQPGDAVTIFRPYQRRWIPAVFVKKLGNGPLLRVYAAGAKHEEYVHPNLVRDARQGGLEL